ncbi:lactadherin-like [Actinia tenebrosa]|uniref:Lactadherin-like n=1 Tax=Actinia tenebrosa TaxID=6105 RepID=A0A6P8I8P2_ACTTE|nr:lactadherin-like [Actinia tenebrosa]
MNDACVSYNLGPTRGMSRTCELSDTDHVGFPDHVVGKEGAEYCPIRSPCSSKSCPADLICKPDFSWDTFRCSCYISKLLGMEDGRIPDSAITASSSWDLLGHGPHQGRLNYIQPPEITTFSSWCWSSSLLKAGEYLQVFLDGEFNVDGVATQGRPPKTLDLQWVKSYTISYSLNGTDWMEYEEDGTSTPKIFEANSDGTTIVKHKLTPFKAKFVRIVVQTWHTHISLRMELYGCKSQ